MGESQCAHPGQRAQANVLPSQPIMPQEGPPSDLLEITDMWPMAAHVGDGVVLLEVGGLVYGGSFEVLLLLHGSTLELEVADADWEARGAVLHVRMPTTHKGFVWMKVRQRVRELVDVSGVAPMLLTDSVTIAEEVSRSLGSLHDCHLTAAPTLLELVGAVLHPVPGAPPSARTFANAACRAAWLGWTSTLQQTLRNALLAGYQFGRLLVPPSEGPATPNLLTAAVQSGSSRTVELVLDLLHDDGMLWFIHHPDCTGRCSLRWARQRGDQSLLQLLTARSATHSCAGVHDSGPERPPPHHAHDRQPPELPSDSHSLERQVDPMPRLTGSNTPSDAESFAGGLSRHRQAGREYDLMCMLVGMEPASTPIILVLYGVAAYLFDSQQNPVACMFLAIVFVTLHILLPLVYFRLYLPTLAELQRASSSIVDHEGNRIVTVCHSLSILEESHRKAYDSFVLRRSSMGALGDIAIVVALAFLMTPTQVFHPAASTATRLASMAPKLVALGVVAPLRAYAVASGRRAWRQWADVALELCLFMGDTHAFIAEGDSEMLPSVVKELASHGPAFVGVGLVIQSLAEILKVTLMDKPLFPGVLMSQGTLACLSWALVHETTAGVERVAGVTMPPFTAETSAAWLLLLGVAHTAARIRWEASMLRMYMRHVVENKS